MTATGADGLSRERVEELWGDDEQRIVRGRRQDGSDGWIIQECLGSPNASIHVFGGTPGKLTEEVGTWVGVADAADFDVKLAKLSLDAREQLDEAREEAKRIAFELAVSLQNERDVREQLNEARARAAAVE